MNPKMILTDLDKTLLRSDGSVSDHTKKVLKQCQERGILVVIATARYWIGAERYIEELKPDYEITTDGTLIHRFGEEIYSSSMDADIANNIVQDLLQYDPKTEITVAAGRQVLWNSLHIAESKKLHKAVYYDYSKPLSCQVNRIVAEFSDGNIAVKIAEKNNRCRLQCYQGENWYAFLPEGSGKIQAIHALVEKLGILLADEVSLSNDEDGVAAWIERNIL